MAVAVSNTWRLPDRGDGRLDMAPVGPPAGENAARINAIADNYTLPAFLAGLQYPADPVTTRQISVSTQAQFNLEAQIPGTEITITAPLTGNCTVAANDVDVIGGNNSIAGAILFADDLQRVRVSNLATNNGGLNSTVFHIQDLLIDNCKLEQNIAFDHETPNVGASTKRIAIINSDWWSEDGTAASQFTFFSSPGGDTTNGQTSDGRHEDFILANCRMWNTSNRPTRIQWVDRCMVLECAFDISDPTRPPSEQWAGPRFTQGCINVYVAGLPTKKLLTNGEIYINTFGSDWIGWGVQTSEWDHIYGYNSFNQLWLGDQPPNTGLARNCTLFSSGSGVGNPLNLPSQFVDGGNPLVQSWDGNLDNLDDSAYGANW